MCDFNKVTSLVNQVNIQTQQIQLRLNECVPQIQSLNDEIQDAYHKLSLIKETPFQPIVLNKQQEFLKTLQKGEFIKLTIIEKKQISWDTYIFKIQLPNKNMVLGLPVGQHIKIRAFIIYEYAPEGEFVIRKYTPISKQDERGSFQLLIKIYRPNQNDDFPEGGVLTPHLEQLRVGEQIEISGPDGIFSYNGQGKVQIGSEKKQVSHIGLIGGGTGITPLFQIIQNVLDNSNDKTKLTLIYSNKTVDDILLYKELNEYQIRFPNQFELINVITRDQKWTGQKGRIGVDTFKNFMPKPSDDLLILFCGTPGFNQNVRDCLQTLNYNIEMSYKF